VSFIPYSKSFAPEEKGFSLLEVLVAFVIVSISLSWALYLVSESSSLEVKIQEEERVLSLLEEEYASIIASPARYELLKTQRTIELRKKEYQLRFEYLGFWPFADAYLRQITISEASPPEVWEKFLALQGREQIFLELVKAEAFRGKTLVARHYFKAR